MKHMNVRPRKSKLHEYKAVANATQAGLNRLPDLYRAWRQGGKAALESKLGVQPPPQ